MIRPTRRCVLLLAAGVPLALLPALVEVRLWAVWLAALVATVAAAGLDAVLALPSRKLILELEPPAVLYVGESDPLLLRLRAEGRPRPVHVEALCDLDPEMEPQPACKLELRGGEPGTAQIPLAPRRRGTAEVPNVWLRWSGPLGLMQRTERRAVGLSVPVTPNLRGVRAAAVRFFANRQLLSGLKVEQYIGDGSEFESLREFQPGFDSRAMDWKASARHTKLLCRDFRAERNHQVLLALDTGHLMREPLEGIPKLDHAISAGLLLAYICLKTGDRVGLFAFDEKVRLYAEPRGGLTSFSALQRQSAELEYTTAETNFTLSLTELALKLRRRSLVIVLTDFVDTVTAELMIENLTRLGRRHVVLFLSLRDPSLERIAEAEPNSLDGLGRSVVAREMAREREVVLRRLRRQGISCIDAPPDRVSTQLVNRYLEIKRRELIG